MEQEQWSGSKRIPINARCSRTGYQSIALYHASRSSSGSNKQPWSSETAMLPNAPEMISGQRTTLDHCNSSIILKYHISCYINFKTSSTSILREDIWVAQLQIRAHKSTMYSQQGRGYFCSPAGLLAHYYSMLVKSDLKAQGLHYSCALLCYPGNTHTKRTHTVIITTTKQIVIIL